ncbi:uncharacterized protein SPSK_09347 [Sporothrix schenckii 1099-18]|uniref:Alpha/beta hydrolase fold-3 domain-containing protein n=2 Tax=Sporothrix schenckii TaxID=29908 RepID=U7Q066_SPOS1|nr:uncharacterized protein SPSK_09347 [Sporothrix schenckii 1099-18]ERT00562.1 hypothetical protein HMPREF1624_03936 [Sporothrix schenckii ATCC 58251]KJR84925.1 hypothetical protein SPSK_09347 [Sporothrix schenckii 1099-18]
MTLPERTARLLTEAEDREAPSRPPFTWAETLLFGFGGFSLYVGNILVNYGQKVKDRVFLPEKRPDIIKTYECRPSLNVHIFYPPHHDRTATHPQPKIPLLFTIHGGGFVIGNPQDSDAWDYDFVRSDPKVPTMAVELNYRKGPVSPFPTAVYDLEALALAVLADMSLPIDTEKVAVAGWSAGGNLALTLASLPSMQGRLRAAVPFYPTVDFSIPSSQKALHRHYKPTLKGFRGRKIDLLSYAAPVFDWSYLPKGAQAKDLVNPLLSPTYVPKSSLPSYIFIVAAELDMLSHEAWQMACKLANRPPPSDPKTGSSEVHPPNELILDDERFAFEERTATSSYKWLLVPDSIHGFDMTVAEMYKSDDMYPDTQAKRKLCMDMIHEWLFSVAFKANQ